MPAKAPTAADALLERVVLEERDRSTTSVCVLRFVFATLNALVVFPATTVEGYTDVWPSRYGSLVYACLAGLLLAVAWWRPGWRGAVSLAPALIDVPAVGTVEYLQAMYGRPGLGIASSVAMMLAVLALSTLTLSRRTIALTLVAGVALLLAILSVNATPFEVRANVVIMTCGVGALGMVVVGKVRALVRASRERDLLGKYVLGERLGAGGMAEVFRATYSPEGGFERTVAVKRILPSWAGSSELMALFRREAELGARLAHPNVVQVLDFGADRDTWFLAMEFVDGVSLGRVLKHLASQGRPLPVPALVWVAHELATALDYVQSRTDATGAPLNLVHRDINPPNILLSRLGEVKVADFGIARTADRPSLTAPGMMRGKLHYAAPEQVTDGALDGRTDLFALGATLFEAAVGRRLFHQPNETEVLRALLEGHAESPASVRAELPAAFDGIVTRLLERAPAARPSSGKEVLDALATEFRACGAVGREQLAALVAEVMQAPGAVLAQVPSPLSEPAADALTRTSTLPLGR